MKNLFKFCLLVIMVCGCSMKAPIELNSIEIVWLNNLPEITPDCKVRKENIVNGFKEGLFPLIGEVRTVYKNESSSAAIQYAVPVNTFVVAYQLNNFDNRLVSIFVNCEQRQVIISARGGFSDSLSWYGPYKI